MYHTYNVSSVCAPWNHSVPKALFLSTVIMHVYMCITLQEFQIDHSITVHYFFSPQINIGKIQVVF